MKYFNTKLITDGKFLSKRDAVIIFFAFLVLVIFNVIPTFEGLTLEGQKMIGILLFAAILWIAEPIPLAVTSLLIIILQPLLGILEAKDVFSSFGNQAVFFLIGAFIIAAAVEKNGLHKRIALKFLRIFENSPRFFTFGIMISCAFLSFIMPEHGVAAFFLPIITSILISMKITPRQSNFGKISMLSVAYGCSIGSLGTLIGGARNPLTIGILAEQNITVTFFDWMKYSMPVVFIALPIVWVILQLSFPIEIKDITLAKEEINNQVKLEGKMKNTEYAVLGILLLTIFLWTFSSDSYHGLAVVAILGSVLLFLTGVINWKDVEKRVPWGVIILYGGAITLGIGITDTGAGSWIANLLFHTVGANPYLTIIGLIIITTFLTNMMSNTGAVAVLLPIGIAIAGVIPEISTLLASMVIALTGGLAFILVIATPGNAITYSSGYFSTRDLLKAGLVSNLICIAIIFIVSIVYWKGVLNL